MGWFSSLFRSFFPRPYRIFVSYSREHSSVAIGFFDALTAGHQPFLDQRNIRLGEDWQRRLTYEIERCTHFYLLWCTHAARSDYVETEIRSALSGRKKIVPIVIGDEPIPRHLAHFHGIVKGFDTICESKTPELHPSVQEVAREQQRELAAQWQQDLAIAGGRRRIAAASLSLLLAFVPAFYLLSPQSRPPAGLSETRHPSLAEPKVVAFTPDAKHVLITSKDRTVRVWDAHTGKEVAILKGNEPPLTSVSFSPNSRFVPAAADDGTMRLWDATSGRLIRTFEGHAGRVIPALFSPDGTLVLTASDDTTFRLWDAASGRPIRTFEGHADRVTSALFSPDGTLVLTASNDTTARLWDAVSGRLIMTLKGHTDGITTASISPDGRRILTASHDGTARVWDAATGQEIAVLRGHSGGITTASISPDGRRILTASRDGTARIWDGSNGLQMVVLRGHTGRVTAASFSPDGRRVLTVSNDETTRVWDDDGREIAVMKSSNGANTAFFTADAKRIVTMSNDSIAHLWEAESGKHLAAFNPATSPRWEAPPGASR